MEITISVNQIITFLLYIATFAVLIYLTISIRNINLFLKELRLLVETNRKNIDSTMDSLPVIALDIKNITTDFRKGVVAITNTAEDIQNNLIDSTSTISEKAETAIEYVQIVGQVIKMGLDYFGDKKHKRKKKWFS